MSAFPLLVLAQAAPADTAGAVAHVPIDTVIVESPLPGGIAAVVRFIFGVPQWVMIGGIILGAVVAAIVLVTLWRRRHAILSWLGSRPRGVRAALVTGAAVFLIAAAGTGRVSWNYMQHDNGFCTGCHVMEDPFKKFAGGAGKHDSLSCHDCHQQSIFASAWQLYFWIAERPEKIENHADIPNGVCARCHVTGREGEAWQRIATTAGHRTHLESDSSALREVRCVTCHGLEIHRFAPVDSTCGQAGCHVGTEIKLGGMAEQTALHCVTCHQFTLDVPALATRDSAAGTLVPTRKQCLGCHEMQRVLAEFDPARDPHKGTCGMCHNPHTQERSSDAIKSCTTAGCHDNWEAEPFHTGRSHRTLGADCTTCHIPHRAKVDASDCEGCHTSVRERTRRTPPVPFDTLRALRRDTVRTALEVPLGKGDTFTDDGRPPPPSELPAESLPGESAAADSFPHSPHRRLACLTCHVSQTQHGRLTFEVPRGCQICHHQAPARSECTTCHQRDALASPLTARVVVRVPSHAPKARPASFRHATHASIRCTDCHFEPVSMAPTPEVRTCAACHGDHHTANRDCATCHSVDGLRAAHPDPRDAHTGCDACHTRTTIEQLQPTRSFCLTCHTPERPAAGQGGHYPGKECTTCHFLALPDVFRARLIRGAGGPG